MMKKVALFAFLMLFGGAVIAQDLPILDHIPLSDIAADIEVEDAPYLDPFVPNEHAVLSPDGQWLAWIHSPSVDAGDDTGVSRLVITNTQGDGIQQPLPSVPGVYPFTLDPFENEPVKANNVHLRWSPDSRFIAFASRVYVFGDGHDLWVYDREEARFLQLTQNGEAEQSDIVTIDYEPFWDHTSDALFFWRTQLSRQDNDQVQSLALYKVDVDGGSEPHLVREILYELGVEETSSHPLVEFPRTFGVTRIGTLDMAHRMLDGTAAVSPDGSTIAFLFQQMVGALPSTNVWFIDVSGQQPPRQQVDPFIGFSSDVVYEGIEPIALGWNEEGDHLIVHVGYSVFEQTNLYVIDPETGMGTPLFDYSAYDNADAETPSGYTLAELAVTAVQRIPGSSQLLLIHRGEERTLLSTFDLDTNTQTFRAFLDKPGEVVSNMVIAPSGVTLADQSVFVIPID